MQSVFKDILNSVLTVFPWSDLSFDQYGKIQTIPNKNHTPAGPGSILHPGCIQTVPPAGWTKPESLSVRVRWRWTPWEQVLAEAPGERAPDFTDEWAVELCSYSCRSCAEVYSLDLCELPGIPSSSCLTGSSSCSVHIPPKQLRAPGPAECFRV